MQIIDSLNELQEQLSQFNYPQLQQELSKLSSMLSVLSNDFQSLLHGIKHVQIQNAKQFVPIVQEEDLETIIKQINTDCKIEQLKQKNENDQQTDSQGVAKIQRGPYNKYSEELKKLVYDMTTQGISTKAISKQLNISSKNISRWIKQGYSRKKSCGRKSHYPEMEVQLFEWIKSQQTNCHRIRKKDIANKAKQLSQSDSFQASKGWMIKFLQRMSLKI